MTKTIYLRTTDGKTIEVEFVAPSKPKASVVTTPEPKEGEKIYDDDDYRQRPTRQDRRG
jgi:hypothetical protein